MSNSLANLAHCYQRPPVVEAVIGLSFALPIKAATLAAVDRRFAKHYPEHQDHNNLTLKFGTVIGANNTMAHHTKQELVQGHRRTNTSMDEIAILQPDSLVVSQLAPYKGWENLFARFTRDFAMCKRPGKLLEISRIGVRFINRIDIPITSNVVEHEKYLNLYPQVPEVFGPLMGYTLQSTFDLTSIGCVATIRSAPTPSPTLGHASFMVDIDVYKNAPLPTHDADIFDFLGQIRTEKNRIFEACVTPLARKEIFGHDDS
jgi:uncharacterized protein (TIGR04255 family)